MQELGTSRLVPTSRFPGTPSLTAAFALLAFLIFALQWFTEDPTWSVIELILFLVIASSLPLSVHFPRATAVMLAIAYLCVIAADARPGLLFLIAPCVVGVLAFRRHWWWALLPLATAMLSGFHQPSEGRFVVDAESFLISLLMFLLPLGGGIWFGAVARAREAEQRRIRERREELSHTLHDDIATRLSSVIVQLEAAGIRSADTNPALVADLTDSALAVRTTLASLRMLIDNLSSPVDAVADARTTSLVPSLMHGADSLRRQGFDVNCDIRSGSTTKLPLISASVDKVLGEALANIANHGDPDEQVRIVADYSPRRTEITIENSYTDEEARTGSNRLGIETMQRHLAAERGDLHISDNGRVWTVVISIPST